MCRNSARVRTTPSIRQAHVRCSLELGRALEILRGTRQLPPQTADEVEWRGLRGEVCYLSWVDNVWTTLWVVLCWVCLDDLRLARTLSIIEHHRALCDPRTFWHHRTLCARGPCCHVRGALACGGFGNNIVNTTTPHMCTYGSLVWTTCTNHK